MKRGRRALHGAIAVALFVACGDDGGEGVAAADTRDVTETNGDTGGEVTPDTTLRDTAPDTEPDTTPDTEPDTSAGVTWDDVYPIFATSCTPCHRGTGSATSGSGGHSIAATDKAIAYDASQLSADVPRCAGMTVGECALIRIRDGSMPATGDCQEPVTAKCPDADEQALIEQWIADGMRE